MAHSSEDRRRLTVLFRTGPLLPLMEEGKATGSIFNL